MSEPNHSASTGLLLNAAILIVSVANLFALVVAIWAKNSVGGAFERFIAEFANQPEQMKSIELVAEVVSPLLQLLIVITSLNLALAAWWSITSRRKITNNP